MDEQINHLERTIESQKIFIEKLLKTNKDQSKKISDLVHELSDLNLKKSELKILKAKNYKVKAIADNLRKIESEEFKKKLKPDSN